MLYLRLHLLTCFRTKGLCPKVRVMLGAVIDYVDLLQKCRGGVYAKTLRPWGFVLDEVVA